jgi:hypothetical protein
MIIKGLVLLLTQAHLQEINSRRFPSLLYKLFRLLFWVKNLEAEARDSTEQWDVVG